jgi:hypothetical protein
MFKYLQKQNRTGEIKNKQKITALSPPKSTCVPKFLPETEQREFLAAKVCGDRKSEDVAPLVVQGGAAICWSSRVTRNWMPLHGSLSNISRFNIIVATYFEKRPLTKTQPRLYKRSEIKSRGKIILKPVSITMRISSGLKYFFGSILVENLVDDVLIQTL